jgi:ribosomal protein S18 acetylase RimI-like enzyme
MVFQGARHTSPMGLLVPRSLVWATDIDTLPLDHTVERREGYLAVRSPGNPEHYWGTLLVFDDPPGAGDRARWEALFEHEFRDDPRIRHRTFAWDRVDGVAGAAGAEFVEHGYRLDDSVGLVADPSAVRHHPREDREVEVRLLDATEGADTGLWRQVIELEVAGRDPELTEDEYRTYLEARHADRRKLFRAGRGAWYVATDPEGGNVVASCGIVVTAGRGRFQSVETAAPYRRRGICSRLVVEAARYAVEAHGAVQLVIVADSAYHALGLYESLGFERREHVYGVSRWPDPR